MHTFVDRNYHKFVCIRQVFFFQIKLCLFIAVDKLRDCVSIAKYKQIMDVSEKQEKSDK
jgi:hypothetical protein